MNAALDVICKTARTPNLKKPAFLDGWTVATDGHRLLAVRGEFAGPPETGFPKYCFRWLEAAPSGVPVDAADFLAFIGPMPEPVKCQECNGRGRLDRECAHCSAEHDCQCNDCDNGTVSLKDRIVKIGEATVNANLLSDVLPLLTTGGQWLLSIPGHDQRCTLFGDGWRFMVMPMARDTVKWEKEFPLDVLAGELKI